ncbi:hypothetical protein LOC68_13815 [Blastopirellula sp. JC732]|uniref:SecDF P1 head subdomain domain-containing protein n=1 Tax=Blastopirellula sediminis TaxID=2894196 RepID=A0A9X1SGY1_9BACT|nr:hypothetical protein [Blastopirellula sediminis]MCC9607235.1 hypothetical protein [Blastopirellula sediminis]MCC9629472.1 hypothetical protein [Blastopirellula sediminis]
MRLSILSALLILVALLSAGCGKPAPPTLATSGGTVLTYKIVQELPDVSAAELQNRIAARIKGDCFFDHATVQVANGVVRIELPGGDLQKVDRIKEMLRIPGQLSLNVVAHPGDDQQLFEAAAESDERLVTAPDGRRGIWTRCAADLTFDPEWVREIDGERSCLLLLQKGNIEGPHFADFTLSLDPNGQHALNFSMTDEGARRLQYLTKSYQGRQLAIVFDHQVISAPVIRSTISKYGMVTGNFSKEEVTKLLRTGKLAIFGELPPLELTSEEKLDPQ